MNMSEFEYGAKLFLHLLDYTLLFKMPSGIPESLPMFLCLSLLCQIIIVKNFLFFFHFGWNKLVTL